jgi:hypothetical protein
MTAVAISVTGCDASGTVANAFTQTKQTSAYTSTPTLTFDTTVTDTTVEFFGINGGTTSTVENTEVVSLAGNYNSTTLYAAYTAAGDDTPSSTNAVSQYSALIAGELKEAAAGGGATPKGPLGMPIRGPFGGPV